MITFVLSYENNLQKIDDILSWPAFEWNIPDDSDFDLTMEDAHPPDSLIYYKTICHSLSDGDMEKYHYLLYKTEVPEIYEMIAFNQAKNYIDFKRNETQTKKLKHGRN